MPMALHREIVQKLSDFSAFLSCNKLKSEKVKKLNFVMLDK
jgi:hypothetical protein